MHIHGVRRRLFGAAMSIAAAVALIAVQAAAPVDAGIPRGSFHQTNLAIQADAAPARHVKPRVSDWLHESTDQQLNFRCNPTG